VSAPSSPTELARRTFRRLALAQVLASGPPAVVVAAFLVAFLEPDDDYVVRNATALALYGAFGFLVLIGLGRLHLPRELGWVEAGRAPTARERDRLLLAPLGGAAGAAGAWGLGAVLFTLINLDRSLAESAITGGTIVLGGASTSAIVYLTFERILRPLFALALADQPPSRPVGPSVGARISTAWLLTSGVPAMTILGLSVAALLGAELSDEQLALGAAFFSAGVLVVGLFALRIASRAVADPITSMRTALAQVEAGEFGTRVEIEDGSEIGQLQAGFNRMAEGLGERERLREAFGTYVDRDVAEHILREGTSLEGEEVEVTVMFVDVRDFTGFAERLSAAEVVAALNRLFARAVPIIHAHGGHVDKFIGDGLLAVFGAPRREPAHADRALSAALDIERAVRESGPLRVGIGLNSGTVVAGNVGGAGRLEFSVIGDAVNVAARVEAATRATGDAILVTASTRDLATASCEFAERPGVELKGKREPVILYAPLRASPRSP
jgi:adenylate cyclase